MNTTGQSNYQYFGTNIDSRYRVRSGIMIRYGYGNVSRRHRISDILFIRNGEPQIVFSNVRNAQDVVKLVESMRILELQGQQPQ